MRSGRAPPPRGGSAPSGRSSWPGPAPLAGAGPGGLPSWPPSATLDARPQPPEPAPHRCSRHRWESELLPECHEPHPRPGLLAILPGSPRLQGPAPCPAGGLEGGTWPRGGAGRAGWALVVALNRLTGGLGRHRASRAQVFVPGTVSSHSPEWRRGTNADTRPYAALNVFKRLRRGRGRPYPQEPSAWPGGTSGTHPRSLLPLPKRALEEAGRGCPRPWVSRGRRAREGKKGLLQNQAVGSVTPGCQS